MKLIKLSFLVGIFLLALNTQAALSKVVIEAKVTAFDTETVTLQIAGQDYKFNRAKLGDQFKSIKKSEKVEIEIDKEESLKKNN